MKDAQPILSTIGKYVSSRNIEKDSKVNGLNTGRKSKVSKIKISNLIPSFESMPDCGFIRQKQLFTMGLAPFSAPTLWRKVKAGTFPKPCKLSARVTGWRVGDIRAWLQQQGGQA